MFFPNQESRKSLAKKLNLRFDESMQDWEYEISTPDRIDDFINEYKKSDTTDSEKESLIEIILDSLNDLDEPSLKTFKNQLKITKEFLTKNKDLHSNTVDYWKESDFKIARILNL